MGDAGNRDARAGQSEIALRQGHRIAFGIVDAHIAVLQIAALGDDHAARIKRAIARERLVQVRDRDAEMVQPDLHARLVQLRPLLEQSEVEAAVREGDVTPAGAPDLPHAAPAPIEAPERRRLRAQHADVAYTPHLFALPTMSINPAPARPPD